MTGTDAPVPLMAPGFSLHGELATLVDIGLTPFQALQASTYNPALYLRKLDEFGTVETGKRADLVLLEGNPLEDIFVLGASKEWFDADPVYKEIETLKVIMKDGVIYKNSL